MNYSKTQQQKSLQNKLQDLMSFYLLATSLKYKIRSGWDCKHWNISKNRLESIAEHIYGTCILAIAIESEFTYDINLEKVIKMLVIHELEEVIIGDITPFEKITEAEKQNRGHQAIVEVIGDLIKKDELINLILEFDAKETKEAQFAYHCDKLEADLQAKIYQDTGYQHNLDDQQDNIVFKSEKVQKMIKDGAKTAFDIWYEWDKTKFTDDPNFSEVLNHAKNNSLSLKKKNTNREKSS